MYRLDKRRWGDEPVVVATGIKIKGALRAPLSVADVFFKDRRDADEDGEVDNSEISHVTAVPSPSPPPSAEPGAIRPVLKLVFQGLNNHEHISWVPFPVLLRPK